MSLRHHVFAAALQTVANLRADRWLREFAQGCGVILMFHRVRPQRNECFAPNRELEITPEFLDFVLTELRREGFEIVPLEAVPYRLRKHRVSRPFAVLTFDDGYRDVAEYAWPILKRHDAAWTLFVTTEFAEGKGRPWWIELEEALTRLDRIILRDEGNFRLPARTASEKQAGLIAVCERLCAGPEERLLAATSDLAIQAGIDVGQVVRTHCLAWDEIRALASDCDVTIGAHGISHSSLAKHDASTAAREIAESRVLLEHRLGRSVDHFAYPFGGRFAAGAREFRLARHAGFATAVTTRPGHLFPDHADHLHALPRVSINGRFQSNSALRALLSGIPFLALNRGRVAPIEA